MLQAKQADSVFNPYRILMNELFPGERVLTESADKKVTLTTRRIGYSHSSWGSAYHQHIMLEHVSGCEYRYGLKIWLLALAAIMIIFGLGAAFSSGYTATVTGSFCIALVCIYFFLRTRLSEMTISSSGTKMRITVTGLSEKEVLHFLFRIEKAQQEHMRGLYNSDMATL